MKEKKRIDITSELLKIQGKQGTLTAEGVLKEAKKKTPQKLTEYSPNL